MGAVAFVCCERRSGLSGGAVMQDSSAPQLVVGSNSGDTISLLGVGVNQFRPSDVSFL